MSKSERQPPAKEVFSASLARLCGAYAGVLAFWITHVVGLIGGVRPTVALMRAAVAGVALHFVGRVLGRCIGRSLAAHLVRRDPPVVPDAEAAS